MSKKHKDQKAIVEKNFPKQCSLCEKNLNDNIELKKHMRTHSYSFVQFKCDLCGFMGCEEIDMNVHTSKMHGDIPECGLCDYKAKNLEDIDIHLPTCE